LEQLRRTQDKSGRLVSTNFLTLPDRKELPDYYEVIKMPIALDTVEAKLKAREFPTMTTLESYFKRMVANAKEYNERGSEIFDDAERIRKAVSNYMTKHNPAYKTPGYVAFATPLPDENGTNAENGDEDAEGEVEDEVPEPPTNGRRAPARTKIIIKNHASRTSATPVKPAPPPAGFDYAGLEFQEAQDKLVVDMMKEPDPDEYVLPRIYPGIKH
jgi:hypothetical protein